MFTGILHKIVAIPWVYDLLQFVVRHEKLLRLLDEVLSSHNGAGIWALDAGGGTGSLSKHWPADAHYVCMDIDGQKLSGFRLKFPHGMALQSDVTRAGIRDGAFDVVVTKFVLHHLGDEETESYLRECMRLVKPSGTLIIVDAYWDDSRHFSKLMWRFDRGSFPRPLDEIKSIVEANFQVQRWEEVHDRIYNYFVCIASKDG